MTFETSGQSNGLKAAGPPAAYADAPGISAEISWVAQQAASRRIGTEVGREFWLRKAAVLDRIALEEVDTYAPEVAARAVQVADQAAIRLVERDSSHALVSLRGADLITGADHREYVREAYREWSLAPLS